MKAIFRLPCLFVPQTMKLAAEKVNLFEIERFFQSLNKTALQARTFFNNAFSETSDFFAIAANRAQYSLSLMRASGKSASFKM